MAVNTALVGTLAVFGFAPVLAGLAVAEGWKRWRARGGRGQGVADPAASGRPARSAAPWERDIPAY